MKRYLKIDNNKTETGKRYIANAIYPRIPETEQDIYVIATAGDRYDILASQFYRDSSLWWIIAASNNIHDAPIAVDDGTILRIPKDYLAIINKFKK